MAAWSGMVAAPACARAGWPPACLPLPAGAERASFRDTTREQGPGDGFRGRRSVRSAVVSDAREPGSGETHELATMVTPGVSVITGKAGR